MKMELDDLTLPWFTSTLWILGVFLLTLAGFHLVFVRWWPLDKVGWKKVDYLWLSLVVLGLIGGVGSARQEIARGIAASAESRLESAEDLVEDRLSFGQSSVICRTFIRSESSPPPEVLDQMQREFDQECAWFRAASDRLPTTPFVKRQFLRIEDFGNPPSGGDRSAITNLEYSIRQYNEAVAKVEKISNAAGPSDIEAFIQILGPVLLAIALALRLTKVTGEIRLERCTAIHRES